MRTLQVGPKIAPEVERLATGAGAPSAMNKGSGGLPAPAMKGNRMLLMPVRSKLCPRLKTFEAAQSGANAGMTFWLWMAAKPLVVSGELAAFRICPAASSSRQLSRRTSAARGHVLVRPREVHMAIAATALWKLRRCIAASAVGSGLNGMP